MKFDRIFLPIFSNMRVYMYVYISERYKCNVKTRWRWNNFVQFRGRNEINRMEERGGGSIYIVLPRKRDSHPSWRMQEASKREQKEVASDAKYESIKEKREMDLVVEAVYQDDTFHQRLLSPKEGRDPGGKILATFDSPCSVISVSTEEITLARFPARRPVNDRTKKHDREKITIQRM